MKAACQNGCALLPHGSDAYEMLQRRFGNVGRDPLRRVSHHARMVAWLAQDGRQVEDMRCMEVVTGHVPLLPVLFHLLGSRSVVTVDLHRRVREDLTIAAVHALAEDPAIFAVYEPYADVDAVLRRLDRLKRIEQMQDLFRATSIEYVAPGDAARMGRLASGSIDLHFSTTVLEHVPPAVISAIMRECRRVLAMDGVALHVIDLSDHFAHDDGTIGPCHFLRWSEASWKLIAGNQFGYCNRLRQSELTRLFASAGFAIRRLETKQDQDARLLALNGRLRVNKRFGQQLSDIDDLTTTELAVLLSVLPTAS